MQRDTTVGIPIFPSDGISRIRFTGQSQQAHSQPDASGPPKTYLLGVDDIIQKMGKIVKHTFVGRSHDSAEQVGYSITFNTMQKVHTARVYFP